MEIAHRNCDSLCAGRLRFETSTRETDIACNAQSSRGADGVLRVRDNDM
jgi:hypothetical protein